MSETFCPECGTVFESTGTICPNCAANVGGVAQGYTPKGKASAISVMPLAKDSGNRAGFAAMDGESLQLRDRAFVQTEQREHAPSVATQPESGLAVESRPSSGEPQMMAPELPPESAVAESETADGGWVKPIVIVALVIGVAFGGKVVLDLVRAGSTQSAEEYEDDEYVDDEYTDEDDADD